MADEQPGAAEQALHLELENLRIGVDPPVHAPRLDQPADLVRPVQHGHSSLCAARSPKCRIRPVARQGKAEAPVDELRPGPAALTSRIGKIASTTPMCKHPNETTGLNIRAARVR